MMKFETIRFGMLEVSEDKVINIPNGIIGFPNIPSFVLLDYKDTLLKWLQAVNDPAIAFIVLNPLDFFTDYKIKIDTSTTEFLECEDESRLIPLAIARVDGNSVLVNLKGPILVNPDNKRGIQVVNEDTRFSIRTPLTPLSAAQNR